MRTPARRAAGEPHNTNDVEHRIPFIFVSASVELMRHRLTMVAMSAQTSFEPSPLAPRLSPEDRARDRDLGFGSVVGRDSRQRLLNHDGSFNVARYGLGFLDSFAPYHL